MLNARQISFFRAEDAPRGDITTQAIFGNKRHHCQAHLIAKEDFVLSGLSLIRQILARETSLSFKPLKKDGMFVKKHEIFATLQGCLQEVLLLERLCLNFLQHLSGIATLTRKFVQLAEPYRIKILDTRKTTPGLRQEEKDAVKHGGGFNHRFDLSDQYLIKDNHIRGIGSVQEAIVRVKKNRNLFHRHNKKIEVEVKTLDEFEEALALNPDIILLDNFTPQKIKKMVSLRNLKGKKTTLEISGGIRLKNMRDYLSLGVERISIGELTHSARAVDISLKIC